MTGIFDPLALPCGTVLPNRIAKAAMEEHLAGPGQLPDHRLRRLYREWACGGVGLIITGNVMVDAAALTSPGGVVLDSNAPIEPFTEWANVTESRRAQIWMQINHPGRQVYADMPGVKMGPSAVPLDMGKQSGRFATPTPMSGEQIANAVNAYVTTARRASEAGFDGVQIHAAHGYLLSQFLSPLANSRSDEWGGTLANRARALLQVVMGIRRQVPESFAVAVKLNSADFQRGGFDLSDAIRVVELLNDLPVDLVEVSGGNFESPAMQGLPVDERTLEREAYFLEFAEEIRRSARMPLMLTGGIRTREAAETVVRAGIDVVGMGTALAVQPDIPQRWRSEAMRAPALRPISWSDKALASSARQAAVRYQLHRIARGRRPRPTARPAYTFARDQLRRRILLRRYRSWLQARPPK